MPGIMDRNQNGYVLDWGCDWGIENRGSGSRARGYKLTLLKIRMFGIFWKCARIGERLSPYVSICCVLMAVSYFSHDNRMTVKDRSVWFWILWNWLQVSIFFGGWLIPLHVALPATHLEPTQPMTFDTLYWHLWGSSKIDSRVRTIKEQSPIECYVSRTDEISKRTSSSWFNV